ncbi:MAG: hypothetical protein AAB036_00340 [Elusimicrobiota bacterium]
MGMEQWDERALREINSLDAARLAIRGALATIRDLQDQNGLLKGQVQDESGKRKMLETRLSELEAHLAQWQEQAAAWEAERLQREQTMERWKTEARLEAREEERARVEADRRQTEETLARLRADLVSMSKGQKGREDAWAQLRDQLDARDADLAALRREKQDILAKVKLDAEMMEQLRSARDRELAETARARETELQDKNREIASLDRELEENKRALAAIAHEGELKLKTREEALVKSFQQKEQDLVQRYQQREAELQARWSELETGLWHKTKESRAKLDEAVQKQFEERARQIADRAQEVEALLARRKVELDEAHTKRCAEAEAHYAADERRLLDAWSEREKRLLAKADMELNQQRGVLQATWAERGKQHEAEHAERLRLVQVSIEEVEAEGRRTKTRLLEEAARKDAERVRAQDDFVAQKSAELEKKIQERLCELAERSRELEDEARRREEARQNDFQSRITALETEHELRRAELLEEHRSVIEAEKLALSAQFEQRRHTLEEEFHLKVAEQENATRSMALQHQSFRETLREEYLRKEKDMDLRWAAREAEFTQRYEAAREDQRRAFAAEAAQTRGMLEEAALGREKNLRGEHERREVALLARHARELSELQSAHETSLSNLRCAHDEAVRLAREKAFEDLAEERAALQRDLLELQERVARTQAESDRARITDAARVKDLQSRLSALESDRRELSQSLAAMDKEVMTLRSALAERDRMREVERARCGEEARLAATAELARNLEEAELDRTRALDERRHELEKAHASRRRSLEEALAERARALDVKEQRLEEELTLRIEEYKAAAAKRDLT